MDEHTAQLNQKIDIPDIVKDMVVAPDIAQDIFVAHGLLNLILWNQRMSLTPPIIFLRPRSIRFEMT
jgi:hypothetical protein